MGETQQLIAFQPQNHSDIVIRLRIELHKQNQPMKMLQLFFCIKQHIPSICITCGFNFSNFNPIPYS